MGTPTTGDGSSLDCSKALLGPTTCAEGQCCSLYTVVSAPSVDFGGFNAPWIGGEIKPGAIAYTCQSVADIEAKPFNLFGQIDNYQDLKQFWSASPEFLNSLLAADKQVDIAAPGAFD